MKRLSEGGCCYTPKWRWWGQDLKRSSNRKRTRRRIKRRRRKEREEGRRKGTKKKRRGFKDVMGKIFRIWLLERERKRSLG